MDNYNNFQIFFPASSSAADSEIKPMDLTNNSVLHIQTDDLKAGKSRPKGEQKIMRKARYAFETRSQVDVLDDGYRWRKYGQKAVKNNKFPRSYYKCTYEGCKVKKQIQRLTNDEGVVLTTYEGVHSHQIIADHHSQDNFQHILTRMQIYPPPTPNFF